MQRRTVMKAFLALGLAIMILAAIPVAAQAGTEKLSTSIDLQGQRLTKLEAAAVEAKSSADNAWMLVCSALVLMMTGPGLALFYGGLVRKKNVLATIMQSFAMMAVVTVIWALFGYSLSFGTGNSFIGGLD